MFKKLLVKIAYWIIWRYDRKRVSESFLKGFMAIDEPVNIVSPSKKDEVEHFLKEL